MSGSTSRPPGRPRSEAARRAVLEAVPALADELGPRGVTMEAIARRAGVSKDTLYRWWPNKLAVVLEALAERGRATIPVPDTGTLAEDLRRFLRATAYSADARTRGLLRALAADAAGDEATAAVIRERFLARRRAALREVLEQAVARGELAAADADLAVDLVYGSLWYRVVFGVGPLDQRWADAVADAIASRACSP